MKNQLIESYKKINNISDSEFEQYKDTNKIEIHDGTLLTGYNDFASALKQIKPDDVVVVFTDYDVDGIDCGIIAEISLETLKIGKPKLYYPKPSDGYGLSIISVDKILEKWPDVKYILTADNGINTKPAVDYAYEKGILTIVTDHHEPKPELFPDKAIAVVNPNRIDKEETYPFHDISGAQVIWKLMRAYAKNESPENYEIIDSLQVFAALSIISDVMPVVDENRRLLKDTIEQIKNYTVLLKQASKGKTLSYMKAFTGLYNLFSLLDDKGLLPGSIVGFDTFGFRISPMLNAPRRMLDDSKPAFEVFRASGEEAKVAAKYVYEINELRKEEVDKSYIRFLQWAKDNNIEELNGIVYHDEILRPGIAGLIASKLVDKYNVPVIALGTGRHGSGRAPETFNLYSIMESVEHIDNTIYKSWGGHKSAAGVTLNPNKTDNFRDLFNQESNRPEFKELSNSEIDKSIPIDVYDYPSVNDVQKANMEFEQIKPYSSEVPTPRFKVKFSLYECTDIRVLKDRHVKFSFDNFNVIVWNKAEDYKTIDENKPHEVIVEGELSVNVWNNNRSVQLTGDKMIIKQ